VLNSAYHPEGVLDVNGAQIPCPWDVVNNVIQPFKYSASIVTTEKNFGTIRRGSYVEAKMTMPLAQGSWPAFWMVATDQSWPSIELDMFEGFFSTAGTLDQVGTTVHWKDAATGNHTLFSSRLKQLGIDVAVAHVWGVYWGDDEVVFYCDDVPYFAVPNVFPDKDCYLQINIAVGGLVTKPAVPTSYSAQMPIEWVKVWQ
jgi:beta-glucanase (GH16 family)